MNLDKLIEEEKLAKEKAASATKAVREAKAAARWTALETIRTASPVDGARWIRSTLDGVIEADPKAVSADYIIGKMRYSWARKGKKEPKAVIRDGQAAIVYVYTERPAPTDGELELSWNIMSESTRMTMYTVAKARSTFAVPDDGTAPEAGIFIKAAQ